MERYLSTQRNCWKKIPGVAKVNRCAADPLVEVWRPARKVDRLLKSKEGRAAGPTV